MKCFSGSRELAIQLLIFGNVPKGSCKPNEGQGRDTGQEHGHLPLLRPRWFLNLHCQYAGHRFFSLDREDKGNRFWHIKQPLSMPTGQASHVERRKEDKGDKRNRKGTEKHSRQTTRNTRTQILLRLLCSFTAILFCSSGRPAHGSAAEQMEVQMGDGLAG